MRDVEAAPGESPRAISWTFSWRECTRKVSSTARECGYGVTVFRVFRVCPMCGGSEWEQSAWSPLTRAPASIRQ